VLTATHVRALATHRAEPVVTSVYLDVDGRSRPVADDYRTAFAQLADNLHHRVHTLGGRRTERAVRADIDNMHAWLGQDLDRSATRGVALFSASEQDWFETVALPRPVHDDAGIGPAPRVAQLLAVLDEYEPVVAVLADQRRLRVLLVETGELAAIADLVDWRTGPSTPPSSSAATNATPTTGCATTTSTQPAWSSTRSPTGPAPASCSPARTAPSLASRATFDRRSAVASSGEPACP
jgi:hypothetical protein